MQIGLRGAEPSGGGDGHLEAGPHPPVCGDDLQKAVHIGAFQLGVLPVLQHLAHDGVLAPEFIQHLRVGGVAGFCLLVGGHSPFIEEDFSQLFGGVDIELPGVGIDLLLQCLQRGGERFAEALEGSGVHPEACVLHLCKHLTQGQLHVEIQPVHAGLFQLWQHCLMQRGYGGGIAQK